MASGGGNRPTNLSFSVPPSFSSTTLTSSLQTPDTNTFFLSSLSSGNAERDAPGEMLGNASPNAVGSQSFSSLEELLNVTGINSPDLGGAESSSRSGVDSLQQLAKEVESKQLGKCICVCGRGRGWIWGWIWRWTYSRTSFIRIPINQVRQLTKHQICATMPHFPVAGHTALSNHYLFVSYVLGTLAEQLNKRMSIFLTC